MKYIKQLTAVLLVLAMLLGLVACSPRTNKAVSSDMDRQDKEMVAELIGGHEDSSSLTDQELDDLIDDLINNSTDGITPGSDVPSSEDSSATGITPNPDAYDENGAMTKPFDQVYPEQIETEQVTFSGESILIKAASDTLTDGLKAAGIGALECIVPMGSSAWYEAKLSEGTDAKDALAAVRNLDEVLLAEYNYEAQIAALDDYKHFDKEQDEEFKKNGHNKDQWHFHHCGIVDGYASMKIDGGDSSVIVAVIDSGVDYEHEDLKDNMWVNADEIPDNGIDDDKNGYVDDYYGVDIVARKGNGGDTNGHGTHVAGIIAARNNNVGVLGIAYNVKIMSVKAAAHNGSLTQADIAKAVLYAYENGAEVINMSFGGSACSIAVQDALMTAYSRCVLVASAGNNGAKNEGSGAVPNYPAALTYVLGVMSVDSTGKESAFTNWDVYPFSGVEYELYAPGEQIMSTLPGNKYGFLSGTSMAAPVVSAFAAILRSEFTDRSMYPTKFIYGQLASTSAFCADCISPDAHKKHNLPQIADLHAALTKLPTPEVGLQDYALFDDPKYSAKNNGDGVIDAGETIALGLTLRNRWGKSDNTLVTIDTISSISGLADPYITIHNPTVDYGSVGTYSTQDCGKVYTNELHTGWEAPFLITISEDCPNDYRFTLNVSITCENALDETDSTVYESKQGSITQAVRNGVVLPSVIEEDMTLTADSLYIIPNATVIQEGVTVRVMPGTHIQFWSDDPSDPYADSYMASLLVKGNFLVEGTKDDPVYIYPSQLMSRYCVKISSTGAGYVSLKYADITNLMCDVEHGIGGRDSNNIDLADHCTFRGDFGNYNHYSYRTLKNGAVSSLSHGVGYMGNINAQNCIFYKLFLYQRIHLDGNFDRCIFNQCGITMDENCIKNCVFFAGKKAQNSINAIAASFTPDTAKHLISTADDIEIFYRPETGTTYVIAPLSRAGAENLADLLSQFYGGHFAILETKEEMDWLRDAGVFSTNSYTCYNVDIRKSPNGMVWSDGTKVGSFIEENSGLCGLAYGRLSKGFETYTQMNALFEIPGFILPEDITFFQYAVNIDTETPYQLAAQSAPQQLPADAFLYESSDEGVLTVSDTGLVTPVSAGTADVWVWSPDKALRNRVTFTVQEAVVALEKLEFPQQSAELAIGEQLPLYCVLTPADTTRGNVVYTSSDDAVATVENGIVTARSSGTVTITAACQGLSTTMDLTIYNTKATSLTFDNVVMPATLTDGTIDLPAVTVNEGAEAALSWRSTDESVAIVENDKLILKAAGTTSLIVTDSRSGLSTSCFVCVGETAAPGIQDIRIYREQHLVLLENGDLYHWNCASHSTPALLASNIAMLDTTATNEGYGIGLQADGNIWLFTNLNESTPSSAIASSAVAGWDIADFAACAICYANGSFSNGSFFIRTVDGSVYSWGENDYGQLGLGVLGDVETPSLVNLEDVVEMTSTSRATYFLTEQGELYAVGDIGYITTATPVLLDANVAQLQHQNTSTVDYLSTNGRWKSFRSDLKDKTVYTYDVDLSSFDKVAFSSENVCEGIGIKDGKLYPFTRTSAAATPVPGINNAADVYSCRGTHYIITEDGLLFGLGKNSSNDMAGMATESTVTTPVMIPLVPLAEESVTVTGNSLQNDVLTADTLTVSFNKALISATPKLYADGTQIPAQFAVTEHNRLAVSRNSGFAEGINYELVFEVGTLHGEGGVTNTTEIRVPFTYTAPVVGADNTVYQAILDENVERILTAEALAAEVMPFIEQTQFNPTFSGNAILNPISTNTDVTLWFRPVAPTVSSGSYSEIPLGGNWWGTTDEKAIELQMVDYTDFITYARFMYAPYLTEAPENAFPFVTSVKLFNKDGEEVKTVGNETITVRVTFNRDMDTSIPLLVQFGSAVPYADYTIEGAYVDARTWEATYTLNTLIENGNQYFTISNGCSATDDLDLQTDPQRFGFVIDTTAAQALIMQGTATDTGIQLTWKQDEFQTLMGYNIYRSDKEDGLYTRLNSTVIPAATMEWFDDTVEPGKVYYYNFTVVQTDLSESTPSGKIVIMSKDTMEPNIYHSPVANAFTNSNLVINATVTDNLTIAYANLYYREAGTDSWITIRMNKLNDTYSAIIPANYVTVKGLEYYIEAFDGVNRTYKASAETPYTIVVQEAIDANALGDVNGDGVITNLDALILLYAINDNYNMSAEEFARADLNGDKELSASEALRILQYVNGIVGSVKM